MIEAHDFPPGWATVLESIVRRLERVETKLDSVGAQVARILAVCAERGDTLKTVCKDLYGNGSPGLKTQASTTWMIVSGLGGGLVVLLGQLLYAAIAKTF